MALDHTIPINDEDIPYELDILRNPEELEPWLRYLDFKGTTAPTHQLVFIYERACRKFTRSYKLWKAYLDLRVQHLKYVDYGQNTDQFEQVYALFNRALFLLNKMPRLWTDYLAFLLETCPETTRVRRTFDKALQSLPVTQHDRVWPLYLQFASTANPRTKCMIWERYLIFDDSEIENYTKVLVENGRYTKACENLIRTVNDPDFESSEGKSRFQLWEDLVELLVTYDTELEVEKVIKSAIARYTDQRGKLWVNLATYWIRQGNHERARDIFEQGIQTALSVRDFTQIFDSYVEFEETLISKMLENEHEYDPVDIDIRMAAFEKLMDRRPFIINDILLKQDPNNVSEWQKRVRLWKDDTKNIVDTYTRAIQTISPKKASGELSALWADYAKFYENGGDLDAARVIFDKGTKVPFASVNELADVWIEWAEMETRQEDIDRAVKVLSTAVSGPKKSKINFFNESLSPQERLHKCMKLWSYYLDLVESGGDLEEVKPLYDRIFELKIGTALTVVNYANLLEERGYYEDSFKAYERGLELFSYPVAFELWNLYLNKAMTRQLGLERLRDLFEQALEKCPSKFAQPIYLLYANLEETRGLFGKAMRVYERALQHVDAKDKLQVAQHYIAKVSEHRGLPATRDIFQRAMDVMPDGDTNTLCHDFIAVEVKLGEIERARAIYTFAAQLNDPDRSPNFWTQWEEFEVQHGNEATYKEMLRMKRTTKMQYHHEVAHIAGAAAQQSTLSGFVMGSEQPKQAQPQSANDHNPDEIDIDL